MEIKLSQNFSIKADTYSWTLERAYTTVNEKTQKETESKEQWWYPKISDCINKYKEEALKYGDGSLENLLEQSQEVLLNTEAVLNKITTSRHNIFKP